ncbi:MAG: hypothetical protein EBS17_08990, partial [Flavobacteriia bacterium]|nr:hypothetical protein [Flavobacteriia bacterium]
MTTKTTPEGRITFSSVLNPLDYPDFLDIQLKSFKDFFQLETLPENRKYDGLYRVFAENFPISDTRNNFVLEFLDYFVDPPRYSIEECIERGLTYNVPLKAKVRLSCNDKDHEDFETIEQEVYLGLIPYMTPKGTFVINGSERVIVSQLHRSPGVFFGQTLHSNGSKLYSARIIPFKGSWIEFATDVNNVMYAYIDRKKKFPVTTLLRAIGFNADKDILNIFLLCQENSLVPSPLLLGEIQFASNFLEDNFANSEHAVKIFKKFISNQDNIGKILTKMHHCGVLAKLIPEFGECTNYSLFSYHHQYTIDEHTL